MQATPCCTDRALRQQGAVDAVMSLKPCVASTCVQDAPRQAAQRGARSALFAALLGFFVITLDAVVVNVALPTLGRDLGAGVDGLQWVVDGYTLMFGALLLSAGALADRIGARRAFGVGLMVFVVASMACGSAPTLAVLVDPRRPRPGAP